MIVLGINPGIDGTAALVVDGQIAAVVEEERLSRVKMHLGFPRKAIEEVLRLSGVRPGDVNCVAFPFLDYLTAHPVITRFLLLDKGCPFDPENPLKPLRLIQSLIGAARLSDVVPFSLRKTSETNYGQNETLYLQELARLGLSVTKLIPVDHHLSHAASAYYFSGFEECLIVTADGCGDGLSATVNIGKDGRITRIRKSLENSSAGLFYASVTAFLGFKAHRHEGKITGLAAYGNPDKCYEFFTPCLKLTEDKRSFSCEFAHAFWPQKIAHLKRFFEDKYYRKTLMNSYDEYYRKHLSTFRREDIAAAAQKRLEDVFIEYLGPIVAETGLHKMALAGGVFGNVKLNQRIYESLGIKEIFIHPSMGDGGNALGSAWLTYLNLKNEGERPSASASRIRDVYLGPAFSDEEIEKELRKRHLQYRRCDNIETIVADKLARKQIVGRFNGRMEYGPRALGNRSILAHPSDASINKILNERLHRTEFMPFAPSVLLEDAQSYFQLTDGNLHAAEFMTITCDVQPEKRDLVSAVCHVDGTARPNVVRQAVNPSYYKIIHEFKKRTGIGVVVNTSFNIHEEPIVCSPADACIAFQQNSVDVLAIGNLLVERT